MRYFLHLAFNGTRYHGWQIQRNAPSVQACLESALHLYLGDEITVTGCGRTDTGVHARDYWAHFDSAQDVKNRGLFTYKINAILPSDITVLGIFPVPTERHARFDATYRTYRYFLRFSKEPFCDGITAAPGTYGQTPLNITAMNEAAQLLLGTHDFTSFSKSHTQTKTNFCTVTVAHFLSSTPDSPAPYLTPLLVFEVTADRFLRNMVRSLVGTLLEIGRGNRPVEWILQVLEGKSRSLAGNSVPAEGLFLWKVAYAFEDELCM